jgi:uncharacterized protein (DUF736 family)
LEQRCRKSAVDPHSFSAIRSSISFEKFGALFVVMVSALVGLFVVRSAERVPCPSFRVMRVSPHQRGAFWSDFSHTEPDVLGVRLNLGIGLFVDVIFLRALQLLDSQIRIHVLFPRKDLNCGGLGARAITEN